MTGKTILLDKLKRILAKLDEQDHSLAAIRIAEAIAILEQSDIAPKPVPKPIGKQSKSHSD